MQGIAAYKDMAVSTQTRGRLIVVLYEGAVKFLRQAIRELEAGNLAEKGTFISKAQAIITELNSVLDLERGGEVAQNLRKLYHFMGRQLNDANMERDPQKIRDVIEMLEELNEAWKAITD
jgi:flagellar protein FliS